MITLEGWRRGETCLFCLSGTRHNIIMRWRENHEACGSRDATVLLSGRGAAELPPSPRQHSIASMTLDMAEPR